MKSVLIKLMFIITTFVVTGCATTGSGYSVFSKPMNIAIEGGISKGMKDYTPEELGLDGVKDVSGDVIYDDAALAVIASKGWSNVGLSGGAGAAVALLLSPDNSPAIQNWILAWVPQSKAGNAKEARALMAKNLKEAVVTSLPDGYKIGGKYKDYDNAYKIIGNECDNTICIMSSNIFSNSNRYATPKLVDTPYFVDNKDKKSYVFVHAFLKRPITFSINGEGLGSKVPFDVYAVYKQVSKKLPDWSYFYVAPKHGVTNIPVMLTEGNAMFFVRPDDKN